MIGFAHRGGRAHAQENTIEAFVKACRMGVTALEADVWLTRDGVAVIDHDGVVPGARSRIPVRQVMMTDLPPHICTLSQLQEAVGADVDLSLDVKDDAAVATILADRTIAGVAAVHRTWLCHPNPELLASWREEFPDVWLVASLRRTLLHRWPISSLAPLGIDVLNMHHRHWTPALVRRCHETGINAFAWGVQRRRRMRRLVSWGIDAIYSDHTDRMVEVLESQR